MFFRLLGSLEVTDAGRVVVVGGGKRRALLALMLLHRNEVVPADRLIDELWGEQPPATAAKGLQVCVWQLRKELPSSNGGLLVTSGGGYVLRIGPQEVDISCFERALKEGERALGAGDPQRASDKLREALGFWRGPPLAEFTYASFAQSEIARLEELRLVALEERIEADLALGRHAQVAGELEGLVRAHPFRETLRAQLMIALYRCGRQAEALDAYRDGRRLMVEELGLEPGLALRELESKVLAQSPELDAPAVPSREPAGAPKPAARDGVSLIGGAEAEPAAASRRVKPGQLVAGAAVLLGAAALAALLRETGGGSSAGPAAPALDLARNSVALIDPATGRPKLGLPLPGRATDVAPGPRKTVLAVTVSSRSLTIVDADTAAILRTVPLKLTPGAVAAGEGGVWVADARRGLVVRYDAGYERESLRVAYRRRAPDDLTVGRFRLEPTSLAVGAGAGWLTDGSPMLRRVDARTGRVSRIRASHRLGGVAVGAGAVWAFRSRPAAVLRVDPRTLAVTDTVAIAGRRGERAPFPIGIATTRDAVWVLNANTATVTRIDPETLGVKATIAIGLELGPNDIAAAGETVWTANRDGSVSRIDAGQDAARTLFVGESLGEVATDGRRVWVTTTARDQQLPGGVK